ncbi:hypothetical protein FOA52_005129 [Chlamydomonas sp. UWO 241]|nr:hypothetical protein FOA52_005129 [Chlamydomonas sp. UWO 241]
MGIAFPGKGGVQVSDLRTKVKREARQKAEVILSKLGTSLKTNGWAVCDDFIPQGAVDACRGEVKVMETHYTPGQIWVGKQADAGAEVAVNDVRGDKVLWLDEEALSATSFIKDGRQRKCSFATLHQVVHSVDELLMRTLPTYVSDLRGLEEGGRSDAMLAIYPGAGSRFARHIDNSANDGRRLTCLCYLNKDWTPTLGGCLRLFVEGKPPVDVLPLGGRLAFFWSKVVAHEVRPAYAPRHSFTLWYYDALEKAEAMAAQRVAGMAGGAGEAVQKEAQQLLRDILAQDVITPSEEGCQALASRVRGMRRASLSIVASVVGLPSADDFVSIATHMRPGDLAGLRDEISRMGLGQHHAPTPTKATQ